MRLSPPLYPELWPRDAHWLKVHHSVTTRDEENDDYVISGFALTRLPIGPGSSVLYLSGHIPSEEKVRRTKEEATTSHAQELKLWTRMPYSVWADSLMRLTVIASS